MNAAARSGITSPFFNGSWLTSVDSRRELWPPWTAPAEAASSGHRAASSSERRTPVLLGIHAYSLLIDERSADARRRSGTRQPDGHAAPVRQPGHARRPADGPAFTDAA